jgi:hypothetical protein
MRKITVKKTERKQLTSFKNLDEVKSYAQELGRPWSEKMDDGDRCVTIYFPFSVWEFREEL